MYFPIDDNAKSTYFQEAYKKGMPPFCFMVFVAHTHGSDKTEDRTDRVKKNVCDWLVVLALTKLYGKSSWIRL